MVKKPEQFIEQEVSVSYTYTRRLRLEEKRCPQCGKTFIGVKKRKYCSRSCQAKADYVRNASTYRQARRERYKAEKKASERAQSAS